MRLKKGERYAHLSVAYYEDEVLQAVADETGYALTTWAAWPYLVARAKRAWSDDNPTGKFGGSVRALARVIGTTVDELGPVLNAMEEGGLVVLERGRLGTVSVELVRFDKWQHASWESEKKMRAAKEREQGKTRLSSEVVPGDFPTPSTDKDKDKEKESSRISESDPAPTKQVIEHFDEARRARPNTRRIKWTSKRTKLIRDRLATYTVEELQQAATIALRRDWAWESGNATPDHVYRNDKNVEMYLEMGSASAAPTSTSSWADL